MRGVNKVILVGTLGRDVDFKTFNNGGCISNFSIATSESWVDKNSGERKEQTEWHRITCSNRLAEIANQYLRKGSKVYIEGSLRTRKWQDSNGQEQYSTEVRCETMQMLDSNNQQGGNNNQQGGYGNQQQNNQQGGYGNQQGGYGNQQHQPRNQNDEDNDIPF